MLGKRDYYLILEIPPISGADEVRRAYRMLSKKYHPDLNPDLRLYSDEKMKELVEAYGVLDDYEKRKAYDNQAQFQVRKRRMSGPKRAKADSASFARKPQYQKEASLLERLISPFIKKDEEVKSTYDPKQADVHFTLGISFSSNEAFFEQAKREFKEALKYDPSHLESLYNYAVMSYKIGEFEEAVVNFQKVLSHDANDQHARMMINLLREEDI
ncbi:MAG: DnaJ domain-containing protein [Chloroflexi bacterium]|nr:DnaJ domain-containing protein [Chloroflexota bacterium]